MSEQLAGFAQRLTHVVNENGGMTAVSAGSEVPLSTLGRYIRGESEPSAFRLAAIARFCGVTVEQLVYGLEASPQLEKRLPISSQNRHSDLDSDPDVVMIPLLDVVASAGPGISNPYPFEIDRLPFPRRWLQQLGVPEEYVQFVPVHGDSMEPTVRDGAVSLVDTRFHAPKIDAIFVVVDDQDVRLKRIGRGLGGSLTLISDNERYETDTLSSVEAAQLRIAGRAFWAGGKI